MTERARVLIEQVKLLSPDEREEVIEGLLAAIGADSPVATDATWKAEIERRLTALDRGEEELLEFDETLAGLRGRS